MRQRKTEIRNEWGQNDCWCRVKTYGLNESSRITHCFISTYNNKGHWYLARLAIFTNKHILTIMASFVEIFSHKNMFSASVQTSVIEVITSKYLVVGY